ncbi:hypothetical protein OIN60_20525 [Paenibacillus sp. P96]|uniref:BclA C-terminal domain-containing protein n=1 Tax=Paenibacillus zeirhizosphaerae TaxID=2987519 RepID=A0ABT9FWV1_9BACL|nr:hypothetical protein [Paenibacillus sp. P96]MDP4099110.1 hypothetical protein [Paenibacillus sp. P96]
MTGVTGPTGPTVTQNNMFAAHNTVETLAPNAVIDMLFYQQNGTAITQGPNGSITLAPNQQYYVDYRANATGPGTAGAGLYLNGVFIQNTNSQAVSNNNQVTLSGNTIIRTAGSSTDLDLRSLSSGNTIYGNSTISVIKLA